MIRCGAVGCGGVERGAAECARTRWRSTLTLPAEHDVKEASDTVAVES